MRKSPSLEADSHSASQEIPRFLWNCRIHKNPSLIRIEPDESSPRLPIPFP